MERHSTAAQWTASITMNHNRIWRTFRNIHKRECLCHYDDVIMGAIASQITSLTIVYPTVYSGADQSKHQSSASLAFVWGIRRGPVNSPHKWPVTLKMFPFDDVIMVRSKSVVSRYGCPHSPAWRSMFFPGTGHQMAMNRRCLNQFATIGLLTCHVYPALSPNLAKSRSREIGCYSYRITLKFDRHLGSTAAEVPVKFQGDWKSLNPNLVASRLHEILR